MKREQIVDEKEMKRSRELVWEQNVHEDEEELSACKNSTFTFNNGFDLALLVVCVWFGTLAGVVCADDGEGLRSARSGFGGERSRGPALARRWSCRGVHFGVEGGGGERKRRRGKMDGVVSRRSERRAGPRFKVSGPLKH